VRPSWADVENEIRASKRHLAPEELQALIAFAYDCFIEAGGEPPTIEGEAEEVDPEIVHDTQDIDHAPGTALVTRMSTSAGLPPGTRTMSPEEAAALMAQGAVYRMGAPGEAERVTSEPESVNGSAESDTQTVDSHTPGESFSVWLERKKRERGDYD
jgi:hypothetical protein